MILASDPLTALLKPCLDLGFRHTQDGVAASRYRYDVINLRLSASSAATLQQIQRVVVGDQIALLDFGRGIVHYPGRHSDPLYVWAADGVAYTEITLYQMPSPDSLIEILGAGGQRVYPLPALPASAPQAALETALHRQGEAWRIDVTAACPFSVIRQTMRFGRFEEQASTYPAGHHQIPLPPAYADYFGVAVNVATPTGDVEHKHILFGSLGGSSGRHLVRLADRQVFAPKGQFAYRYQAAVAQAETVADMPFLADVAQDYDEIELFVPVSDWSAWTAFVRDQHLAARVRVCGVAAHGEKHGLPMDQVVIRLAPDWRGDVQALPSGNYSCLLFEDATLPGYADRVLAARRLVARLPATAHCLDALWFAATDPVGDWSAQARYGVAFSSCPRPEDSDGWRRAQVMEARRQWMRNQPCAACQLFDRCGQMLPFPYPGLAQGSPAFVQHKRCQLLESVTC